MSDSEDERPMASGSETSLGAAAPPEAALPTLYYSSVQDIGYDDVVAENLNVVQAKKDEDNLSLEVNFGELNSCHASDVSSLSFQKDLNEDVGSELEGTDGVRLTRQGSCDSTDSAPGEFPEDSFTNLEEELRKKVRNTDEDKKSNVDGFSGSGGGSTLGEEGESLSLDSLTASGAPDCGGTLKRKTKVVHGRLDSKEDELESCTTDSGTYEQHPLASAHSDVPCVEALSGIGCSSSSSGSISSGIVPSVSSNDTGYTRAPCDGSPSTSISSNADRHLHATVNATTNNGNEYLINDPAGSCNASARNTLEIRNNIPNVNEVRQDNSVQKHSNSVSEIQGVVPKTRKKSPGLAQRLASTAPPDTRTIQGQQIMDRKQHYNASSEQKSSQFQHLEQQVREQITSSLESSPEKSHVMQYQPQKTLTNNDMQKVTNLNDDNMTEIPLNGSNYVNQDGLLRTVELNKNNRNFIPEEKHEFSLSPEATECDSAEVESVSSIDGDGKSLNGMPNVEDGLSSSGSSDAEDDTGLQSSVVGNIKASNDLYRQLGLESPSTAAVLTVEQQGQFPEYNGRHKQSSLQTNQRTSSNASLSSSQYSEETTQFKREAVDMAIRDIRAAIQRSKNNTMRSQPNSHGPNGVGVEREDTRRHASEPEPVWVMRDNYLEQVKRQDEMRRVREEIERQQEDEFRERQGASSRGGSLPRTPIARTPQSSLPSPMSQQHTPMSHGPPHSSYPDLNSTSRSHQTEYNDVSPEDEHNRKSSYQRGMSADEAKPVKSTKDYDTDEETDELLEKQYQRNERVDIPELSTPPVNRSAQAEKRRSKVKQGEQDSMTLNDPDDETVLIEGVLFRARYLGSTQLTSECHPSKPVRMMQAQEAVGRIKASAPEGENQPGTDVDLFISTEKIMVLNTDLQEIMMDHSLRSISYIADIGDIVVIMARRRCITGNGEDSLRRKKQSNILCHVFETDEAQLIAQSIGQAFQVAYTEFLKANGIDDPGLMKEIDYQDVLNQQEIFGEELFLFSNKEMQKEVIVPKGKGEALGVVIVESGWGSMVPTVVLANMSPTGAAARCGNLNIGDQIMAINGISLVGLPLSSCQNYIKAAKNQSVVKVTAVSCPPVVEVLIKRPDVKYQLGFSVQNGVICSLLRGGIAERGGVRVGHRIIEINNSSVVAIPHDRIVKMLASSVGEIHMKTMPTSIFRLLTGQEIPHYI